MEIRLPDREEMLAQLLWGSKRTSLVNHFYPRLLAHAGRTLNDVGLVLVIYRAIEESQLAGKAREYAEGCIPAIVTKFVPDKRMRQEVMALLDPPEQLAEVYQFAAP